jgi:hypothetical protein
VSTNLDAFGRDKDRVAGAIELERMERMVRIAEGDTSLADGELEDIFELAKFMDECGRAILNLARRALPEIEP